MTKFSKVGGYSTSSKKRPADTTAYSAGDVVAPSLTFSDVLYSDSGHFVIMSASIMIDVNAVPSGMTTFKLHLYDSTPTTIADNSAYNLPVADRTYYLGSFLFDAPADLGDTLYSCKENINFKRKFLGDSKTLYGVLETTGGYTPTSESTITIKLHTSGL